MKKFSARLQANGGTVGELLLALYALVAAAIAYVTGHHGTIPFLLLYAASFGTVAGMELIQTVTTRQRQPLWPAWALETAQRGRRDK